MLVAFPIAFLVGTLATDLAFWRTADDFWALASVWLLIAGVVMGALAALAGFMEFPYYTPRPLAGSGLGSFPGERGGNTDRALEPPASAWW
jgi:uncharacterized membrane protein